MLRRISLNVLWLGVSLLASLGIVETTIRFLDLFAAERGVLADTVVQDDGAASALTLRLHPYRGYARPPGFTLTLPGDGPGAGPTVRANRFGFFSGVDDYRTIDREHFVVGVFGGSVAADFAVLGGEALAESLRARMPEPPGPVVILNFGSGGYKQPQQVMTLIEMIMLGIPFDVVLNLDGFNEVVFGDQDALAGHHPLFPSQRHVRPVVEGLKRRPSPEWVEAAAAILRERRRAREIQDSLETATLLGRSALYRAAAGSMVLRHRRRAAELEDELQRSEAARPAEAGIASLDDPCLGEADACWPLIGAMWERGSHMMHAVAREIGARYVHVLQPNQYVPGSKPLSTEERRVAFAEGHGKRSVEAGYPHLRDRGDGLRRGGVAFHDLTMAFAAESETIYRDACCHYNERGNVLLAQQIAALVAQAPE
jgi:hypothetical protein